MVRLKLSYEETHKEIDGMPYKLCNKCNEWFSCTIEYFYKINTSPDGLFPYCKECNKVKSRKWIEDNYEYRLEHKRNIYDKREEVKIRQKNYIKQWHKDNAEYTQEYQLKWQKENRDKIKQYQEERQNKNHKITKSKWISCKEYFNNCCAYCDSPIEEHYIKFKGEIRLGDFHKEHVVHNGNNDLSNCVPSCKICNVQKWEYKFEDWYNEGNSIYDEKRLKKIYKWLNGDYKNYIENI